MKFLDCHLYDYNSFKIDYYKFKKRIFKVYPYKSFQAFKNPYLCYEKEIFLFKYTIINI